MPSISQPIILALLIVPLVPTASKAASVKSPACKALIRFLGEDAANDALNDMVLNGESVSPDVSPTIDWANKGRVGLGNKSGGFGAIVPWAQVYQAEGNRANQAIVDVRNLSLSILDASNFTWRTVVRTNKISGGLYAPNYKNNQNLPGSISYGRSSSQITAASGKSFHFYPLQGRTEIAPPPPAGVLVSVDARLRAKSHETDADYPKYIISAGADYWVARSSNWNHFSTNRDVGIGRFKKLGTGWRRIYMTTISCN